MLLGSREFLRVQLTVTGAGPDDEVDLAGADVEVRIGEAPVWVPAEVTSAEVVDGVGTVHARVLVGAGTDHELPVGDHRVLARLTTAAEAVVVEARPWLSVART